MPPPNPSLSLRARFLLVVVIGAVLPFTLLSAWLVRASGRTGETLLREQLEDGLADYAEAARARWAYRLSDLLLLSQNRPVQQALSGDGGLEGRTRDFLEALYAQLEPTVASVTIRGADGAPRWQAGSREPETAQPGAAGEGVVVRLRIPEDSSAPLLGTLEAVVRAAAVLPKDPGPPLPGATLVAFAGGGETLLLPDSIGRGYLARARFTRNDETWISTTSRIDDAGLELFLAAPTSSWVTPLRRVGRAGGAALLAVLIATVLFALFAIRRLTASLATLAAGADNVARGVLDRKIPVRGDDEIARVSRAFNAMTDNLERTLSELSRRESLAAVGEFASSLAHQIRNGHTSARLDLQRALLPATADRERLLLVGRALERIDGLDRDVTGALRVARSGHVTLRPFDIRATVEGAIRQVREDAQRRGIRIEADLPCTTALTVRGDAGALEQALANLLVNALDAAAGTLTLSVEPGSEFVAVRVHDDGPGIPETVMEHVFDPFFTTRPTGTGLGLPIARRIARAHGGDVRIETGRHGTTATLLLPAATSETHALPH